MLKFILNRKTFFTAVTLAAVGVLSFQNCSQSGIGSSSSIDESSFFNPLTTRYCADKSNKLTQLQNTGTAKIDDNIAPAIKTEARNNNDSLANKKLLLVTDNRCLRNPDIPRGPLSEDIAREQLDSLYFFGVFGFKAGPDYTLNQLQQDLQADLCVEYVGFNYQVELAECSGCSDVPTDPRYSEQDYLQFMGHSQVIPRFYNPVNGINNSEDRVIFAVIDSGLEFGHNDIANRVTKDLYGEPLGFNATSDMGSFDSVDSHGTHVAGLIAAEGGNDFGISGIMPHGGEILPIRAFQPNSSAELVDITRAIFWAAEQGADVINLSVTAAHYIVTQQTLEQKEEYEKYIKYATDRGSFVVMAAGNLTPYSSAREVGSNVYPYPALTAPNIAGAITVGALNVSNNQLANFSFYSGIYVDILAPGTNAAGGLLSTIENGGFDLMPGTSMATPLVAGAAGLVIANLRAKGIDISPEQLESVMQLGAATSSSYLNQSVQGRYLDLVSLMDFIDQDTCVDSQGSSLDPIAGCSKPIELENNGQLSSLSGADLQTGEALHLKVDLSPNSRVAVQFDWYKNGVKQPAYKNRELYLPKVNQSHAGVYKVKVVSSNLEVESKEYSIKVNGSLDPGYVEGDDECNGEAYYE